MRVAIHQSQYLPWPPYFKIIANADTFILMDDVQFQKNGLQNRNKIRNDQKDFWLTIPVSGHLSDHIKDKKLADESWPAKHLNSIASSYRTAPHWPKYRSALEKIYSSKFSNLGEINWITFQFFIQELEIKTKIIKMSDLKPTGQKSDLVLDICKKAEATLYLSGPGGRLYLDEESFAKNNIELQFVPSIAPEYKQGPRTNFISGLSLLDMMMYVDMEQIKNYLKEPNL